MDDDDDDDDDDRDSTRLFSNWWLSPTPLQNDGVRQIGSSSQLLGSHKIHVPKHQAFVCLFLVVRLGANGLASLLLCESRYILHGLRVSDHSGRFTSKAARPLTVSQRAQQVER